METIGDYTSVVDAGFLVEGFCRIVFAHDDGKVAGGVKEYLVAAYADNRFHGYRLAMTGQFRKSWFFTDAVGIPRHDETLRVRALVSAARW